jgi:hypothetical protein
MASEKVWGHLNRPLGYEIAAILTERSLTRTQLKEELPYSNPHNQQIRRILLEGPGEKIFKIPLSRKGTKFTLNTQLFSEDEIDRIKKRAIARIEDSGDTVTTEPLEKQDHVSQHMDGANVRSKFSDDFSTPG